jgi:hypothetical protein
LTRRTGPRALGRRVTARHHGARVRHGGIQPHQKASHEKREGKPTRVCAQRPPPPPRRRAMD